MKAKDFLKFLWKADLDLEKEDIHLLEDFPFFFIEDQNKVLVLFSTPAIDRPLIAIIPLKYITYAPIGATSIKDVLTTWGIENTENPEKLKKQISFLKFSGLLSPRIVEKDNNYRDIIMSIRDILGKIRLLNYLIQKGKLSNYLIQNGKLGKGKEFKIQEGSITVTHNGLSHKQSSFSLSPTSNIKDIENFITQTKIQSWQIFIVSENLYNRIKTRVKYIECKILAWKKYQQLEALLENFPFLKDIPIDKQKEMLSMLLGLKKDKYYPPKGKNFLLEELGEKPDSALFEFIVSPSCRKTVVTEISRRLNWVKELMDLWEKDFLNFAQELLDGITTSMYEKIYEKVTSSYFDMWDFAFVPPYKLAQAVYKKEKLQEILKEIREIKKERKND